MKENAEFRKTLDRSKLTYPCGDPPKRGQMQEVAPGLWWIRMPMPSTLNHINLWAIEEEEGWVVIDSGLQTDETAAAWRDLLAGPFAARAILRVIVTHMHPDHIGMAGWLTRKFDCQLWITSLEYLNCRMLVADTGREAPEDGIRFYRQAGWDEEAIEEYRIRFGQFGKMIYALPDSYRRMRDGECFNIGRHEWRVVVGTGHSPEHACLYCPDLKLLISGDQVLPRISSNVSVFPTEPDADPLGEWLDSIEKLKQEVPNDVLVLPAHNEPFYGLHERLDHLANGHARGLERLRKSLQQPKRARDVFGALFATVITSDDSIQMGLATGEALAHLNYLLRKGEVAGKIGEDGVAWYVLK